MSEFHGRRQLSWGEMLMCVLTRLDSPTHEALQHYYVSLPSGEKRMGSLNDTLTGLACAADRQE